MKSVLIISTLDTKGEETRYLRDRIAANGLQPHVMDLSMRSAAPSWGDIGPEQVASAGGSSMAEIQASRQRSQVTDITIAGAAKIAADLNSARKIDGVIAIGGSTGSLMATEVMRTLPFGVPKLMISSTAALPGLSTRYIGTGDIILFHSVIEISGVTDLLKNVIDRASGAIAGMLSTSITAPQAGSGRAVALTMLGPCEQCARRVRAALGDAGFQVIGFSAAGVSDRAMEEMIAQGFFHAVIDLAPGGVGEHLFGFMRDAGPRRMESAGRAGIPQIISTCSVNHMTPSKRKYTPEFRERRKYDLDKLRSWLRLSPEELQAVAQEFARKLNGAKGPVKILIPSRGWSSADAPGNPTYDPAEDQVFVETLQELLDPRIELVQIDANMEDPPFAGAVVQAAREIF